MLKRRPPGNVRNSSSEDDNEDETASNLRSRARKRISKLARQIVLKPLQTATSIAPMPKAIAAVLKDATLNAVDLAVDEGSSFVLLLIKIA